MNFSNENIQIMIYSIIVAAIFFLVVMPYIESSFNKDKNTLRENLENILNQSIFPLDNNKCSRSCCKSNGWPLPKELLENDIDPEELKNYVPNNFSCTDGPSNKSGCLCVTQQDMDYLTNKAGNIRQ
jgi:hypothetical protein